MPFETFTEQEKRQRTLDLLNRVRSGNVKVPQPKRERGFLANVGASLAEPFVKVGESARALGGGIPATIEASRNLRKAKKAFKEGKKAEGEKFLALAQENVKISQEFTGGRRSEFLGKEVKAPTTPKDVIGTGLEIGSFIAPGGVTKNVGTELAGKIGTGFVKGAVKGAVTGSASGAVGGFLHGAGEALQEDKTEVKTLKDMGKLVIEQLKEGGKQAATGAVFGGAIGGITGGISGRINRKREIKRLLLEKTPKEQTKKALTFKVDEGLKADKLAKLREGKQVKIKPRVVKDKAARKAFSVGIDETDVRVIKSFTPKETQIARKMYRISERASRDKLFSEQAVQEPGKSLISTVKFIRKRQQDVGKQLGATVKGMGDKKIDVTKIADDFVSELDDMGVTVGKKGKLVFKDSRLENNAEAKRLLQQLFKEFRRNKAGSVNLSPQKIHTMRQRLFDDLELGKVKNELTSNDRRILKNIRAELDKPLIKLSDKYKELATQYATAARARTRFNKLMGSDFDISDDLASLRAGEVGRRVLGKASSRPLAMIKEIEDTAHLFGYKKFLKESIRKQFIFADFLEDLFGTRQTQSIRGQFAKGIGDAQEAAIVGRELARGKPVSATLRGLNLIRGHTPAKQKQAVEALLGLGKK